MHVVTHQCELFIRTYLPDRTINLPLHVPLTKSHSRIERIPGKRAASLRDLPPRQFQLRAHHISGEDLVCTENFQQERFNWHRGFLDPSGEISAAAGAAAGRAAAAILDDNFRALARD